MTKWQLVSFRNEGEPWPGLNTRSGKLARAPGELSVARNCIINRDDLLEKRRGIVRGFDERFQGVVCGLFTYTSNCGQEYVVVADQVGFSIRTPFRLGTFQIADCYPFDNFSSDEVDEEKWRNFGGYEVSNDALVLAPGSPSASAAKEAQPALCMRWFKDACRPSYQVQAGYSMSSSTASQQAVILVVRGTGDLSSGPLLMAVLERVSAGSRAARLYWRDQTGAVRELAQASLPASASDAGTLRISYDQVARLAAVVVTPSNGTAIAAQQVTPFTAEQDANFGLTSALGMRYTGALQPSSSEFFVGVVDGGSI